VCESLAVNAVADGLRGVVATAQLAPGDLLLGLPTSCTCFSSVTSRAEAHRGLGALLTSLDVCDEASLALWLAVAHVAAPGECALSAYAHALPEEPPDLPALWPPEQAHALLPWWVLDAHEECAASFQASLHAACSAATRLAEPHPTAERLSWALAHVRARAIRFEVLGRDGSRVWSKCLMPLVDSQNHAITPLPASAAPLLRCCQQHEAALCAERQLGCAASAVDFADGGARWLAARPVAAGEQVSWSYGALSNEALLLQFGFVPSPGLHAHACLELTLPESAFADALRRRGASGDARVAEAREALLLGAGALGMAPGEEALFCVSAAEAPAELMAVCGAICLSTPLELAAYERLQAAGDAGADVAEPAGLEHAQRSRALAAQLLRAAAAQWCGPEAPAVVQAAPARLAAVSALRQAATATLLTAAQAAETAAVPVLGME
jgi:hypothetical protein